MDSDYDKMPWDPRSDLLGPFKQNMAIHAMHAITSLVLHGHVLQ